MLGEVLCATAADGWELRLEHRRPHHRVPRAAALLLHAMMVDRRTFDRLGGGLAGALLAAGVEVFVADFRGHGASGPLPEDGGAWTYDDLVRFDMPALLRAARERATASKLLVVGHSLGGHVAVAAAAEGCAAPDAIAMLASNVWLPRHDPSWPRRALKSGLLAAFRASTAGGTFPARALRVGSADEARDYVLDLAGFWSRDAWTSRDGVDWLAAARGVDVPVWSVLSRGDGLYAHPGPAAAFAAEIGPSGAAVSVLGRRDGMQRDPTHMGLVTDTASSPVWKRVAAWVAAGGSDAVHGGPR